METAKPINSFKNEQYDIEIDIQGQKKLTLTITDAITRNEFYEKDIELTNIGVNTLMKGFEKTKKEIQILIKEKHQSENHLLELTLTVDSPFLKQLRQCIVLKKSREVSEAEAVKKAMDNLGRKLRTFKQSSAKNKVTTFYGANLEQKNYNGAGYENLATINLPKGKYLITFNFLAKTTNQWMYIYFGQGGSILQNAGFYTPSTTYFMPYTLRKIHTVTQES